jgi:hypothetical protein
MLACFKLDVVWSLSQHIYVIVTTVAKKYFCTIFRFFGEWILLLFPRWLGISISHTFVPHSASLSRLEPLVQAQKSPEPT